jgi:hypothetical protein
VEYKNKEIPDDKLIVALETGIYTHGCAGLVKKLGLAWTFVMSASHGLPVDAAHIPVLTQKLKALGYYK